MPILFSKPTEKFLLKFHKAQAKLPFSYAAQAATQDLDFPKGYNHDRYKAFLGKGEDCWQAAKAALSNWQMFPKAWTRIYPSNAPQTVGQTVVVIIKLGPIYWLNGAKVVYRLDEDRQFGFAYGTLTNHAEEGEELFLVSRDEEGQVFFELKAFSLPHHPLAKLGKPVVRRLQKRFARDARKTMQQICKNLGG